jgi:hypothetical protein
VTDKVIFFFIPVNPPANLRHLPSHHLPIAVYCFTSPQMFTYLCPMTGFVLALGYAAFFIFLIRRLPFFQTEGISRNTLSAAFIVKIIFGLVFMAVYSYNSRYQGHADTFSYFEDGKAIYRALFERPLDYIKILLGSDDPSLLIYLKHTGNWFKTYNQGIYNESRTIIRFNAIACIFSFGNYLVHIVFICFLSLIGLTGMLKTFLPFFPNKKKELIAIVLFIPSVLFWGSGVLKEGLILFYMGGMFYYWNKLLQEKVTAGKWLLCLFFAGLLCLTKAYILLLLIPPLIAHSWVLKTGNKKAALKYFVVLSVLVLIAGLQKKIDIPFQLMDKQRQNIFLSSGGSFLGLPETNKFVYISPEIAHRIVLLPDKPGYCKIVGGVPYISWYFEEYTDSSYIQHSTDTTTYWIYFNLERSGSKIDAPFLYPTYASLVSNAPLSFVTVALRPWIFESQNPLMLMSAIENCLVLLFLFLCVCFPSKKIQPASILYLCLCFTASLFILIGLTTPILGAAVRYKIPALPFFLIAFLLILDKEKLLKKLPFLKKIIA